MKVDKVHDKNGKLVGWTARVFEKGVKRRITAPTKGELEQLHNDIKRRERERKLGIRSQQGPITFADTREKFLSLYTGSPRSVRTLRERLVYSKSLDKLYVREIKAEMIQAWLLGLRKVDRKRSADAGVTVYSSEPLHPTTMRGALGVVRQVLDAAVEMEYIDRNPARSKLVRVPAQPKRDLRPFESWAEVFAVADAAGGRNGALIRFACATGLRPQEWQALRWEDVDLRLRVCHVRQTVSDGRIVPTGKTDGSLRDVALNSVALAALNDLQADRFAGGLIFRAPQGGMVDLTNWRNRVFYRALRKAGQPRRWPEEMRHTFATLSLAVPGIDLAWVSAQLGHTTVTTTLRYYKKWLPAEATHNLALMDAAVTSSLADGPRTALASDGVDDA